MHGRTSHCLCAIWPRHHVVITLHSTSLVSHSQVELNSMHISSYTIFHSYVDHTLTMSLIFQPQTLQYAHAPDYRWCVYYSLILCSKSCTEFNSLVCTYALRKQCVHIHKLHTYVLSKEIHDYWTENYKNISCEYCQSLLHIQYIHIML